MSHQLHWVSSWKECKRSRKLQIKIWFLLYPKITEREMFPLTVNKFTVSITQDHPRCWTNSFLCKKSWQHHVAPSPVGISILSRKELDDTDLSRGVKTCLEGCRFNLRAKIWHEIILKTAVQGENFSCLVYCSRTDMPFNYLQNMQAGLAWN